MIKQIQLENLKDENDGFKLRYRMNQLLKTLNVQRKKCILLLKNDTSKGWYLL